MFVLIEYIHHALSRTISFTIFTIIEYFRSGRIIIDLIATGAFFYVFFLLGWGGSIDAEYFFTLTSMFTLGMTMYTMSASISLADRPTCYVILLRNLGRSGFLLGIYIHAFTIVLADYLLVSIATSILSPVQGLHIQDWLLGTIPLMLNVGIFISTILLLSPMIFPTGWRLVVLGMVAVAFSGNFLTGTVRTKIPTTVILILESLQTIFSWPLVPAFSGFALAMSREVSLYALVVIISQASLLIALLGMALFIFSQREVVFSSD